MMIISWDEFLHNFPAHFKAGTLRVELKYLLRPADDEFFKALCPWGIEVRRRRLQTTTSDENGEYIIHRG